MGLVHPNQNVSGVGVHRQLHKGRGSCRQLERLFMGWCILYLTQTMNLFFHVKCLYALSLGEWSIQNYSDLARDFYGFWRYFTDLPGRFSFPFLIWLGFNWDQVIHLIGPTAPDEESRPPKKEKK